MKKLYIIAILSCLLPGNATFAQNGVLVQGNVCIDSLGQVAVFSEVLTLEANLIGDGELIMAAPTRQTIDAKGHSLSRLTIENPAGVDVVSDLVVTKKLRIPQGELRLIDARLIVPDANVIAAHDRQHIRLMGKRAAVIVETEFRPNNQPLAGGENAGYPNANGLLPTDAWHTNSYAGTDGTVVMGRNAAGQRAIDHDIDDPPPKAPGWCLTN